MAIINPVVVEGARMLVRQASSTIPSLLTASATAAPTTLAAASSSASLTTSASAPSDTSTLVNGGGGSPGGNGNGGSTQGSSNSSPLLFFVALGFGVVFTNLWIIVGVKYCFRYNARSRQMRMAEDGEPITMENMPRPHRRRREKKLMTMDEVNEKFPMLKYKTWVASRAHDGLPTRGGVTAPPSRANSVRDVDGVAPELPSKERMSMEERPTTSAAPAPAPAPDSEPDSETQRPQHKAKESTSSTVGAIPPRTSTDANPTSAEPEPLRMASRSSSPDEDEEDDEHINAALPPECMGTSGDTCAICIDTLEDDDDVRGLTCGHAFHAVCLDPWLTSRRACCPLCKADYYTPKPRPPAAEPGDNNTAGPVNVSPVGEHRPPQRYRFFRYGTDNSNLASHPSMRSGGHGGFFGRSARSGNANPAAPSSNPASPRQNAGGMFSNFRAALPAFRRPNTQNRQTEAPPTAAGANVTPSNLEAGVRPADDQ